MGDEKIVRDTKVRQGPQGKPVLYVLVAALLLAGVYMVGMMTWSSQQGPDYAGQSQGSSRAETTGSTSGQSNAPASSNTSGVPAGNPTYPSQAVPSANSGGTQQPKP